MKPKLTESDFIRAAERLRCEVAAIKAVAQVESRGAGFYGDGFPVILFERHIFRRETKGKYNTSHPHLSGPAGNYGPAGKNQRVKFSQAFALNPDAAMKSCSWGKFQIMGFNHKPCGYATVGDFVDAMKQDEGKHLDAFVEFVESQNLGKHLRKKDFTAFARGYNGSGYAKNKYDTKMLTAYGKFQREPISSAATSQNPSVKEGTTQSALLPTTATLAAETKQNPPAEIHVDNVENVKVDHTPPPQAEPVVVAVERVSVFSKIAAGFAGIAGLGISMGEVIQGKLTSLDPMHFVYVIGGIALIAVALWAYDKAQARAHQKTLEKMKSAADPASNTVELTRAKQ
jgi:hypothetical protein